MGHHDPNLQNRQFWCRCNIVRSENDKVRVGDHVYGILGT